jgi:hypothetical protein
MRARHAALVLLAAALALAPVAGGASSATRQLVVIASKGGVDRFTLTPLGVGGLAADSGTVDYCCMTSDYVTRDGDGVRINNPRETFIGKRGTLVLRVRIEWHDAGNGYTVGFTTWKVVKGTGAYAGVTGSGRGAASWLPRGPVSFRAVGYFTPS